MSETEKMAVPTQIKSTTRYFAELIGTIVLVLMGCCILFSVLLCWLLA
jgi:glycerol uptake facilitator-like aquaporin